MSGALPGDPIVAGLPVVSLMRVRLVRKRRMGPGKTLLVFDALVWDPTIVHEVIAATRRHPVAAMLVPGEGGR